MATPVPGIKWSRDPKVRAQQAKHGPGWRPPPKHGNRAPAAAQALGAPKGPEKPFWEMGPGQLKHYATKLVQGQTKTELEPFKHRGAELGTQEGAVAGRYKGYGEASDKLLGGIQQGAEGSAKTFANQVAENAQRAAKEVETSGQNLAGMAGGTSPELRNQLLAQQGNVAGIGAAAGAAAGAQGKNEENFITNLRAAAQMRVQEGQGQIAGAFAKQKGEVGQKESELLGKKGGRIAETFADLSQKTFTNKATEAGLGIKLRTAKTGEANARTKEFAAKTGAEKLGLDREKFTTDSEYKQAKLQLDKLNGANLRKYREARANYTKWSEQNKAKGGKVPTPAEGNKWASKVGGVQSVAKNYIGKNRRTSKLYHQVQDKVAKEGAGKYSTEEIQAGVNLAFYGHLVGRDRENAFGNGLNPEMRPRWFK